MQRSDPTIVIANVSTLKSLDELCTHLQDSHTEKELTLQDLTWDSSTSMAIARMLSRNYGLKKVTLDGEPDDDEEETILDGLNKNIDIIEFSMQCSDQARIQFILERNRQFRIVQSLLIKEYIAQASQLNNDSKNLLDELTRIVQSEATASEVSEVLFHARMRSQFSDPDFARALQNIRNNLTKLKTAGIEHSVHAVQATAAKNMTKHLLGLIQYGADPNIRNEYGQTALIAAAIRGNAETVRILCEAGADKSVFDHTGTTAYTAALEGRRYDIAALLAPEKTADEAKEIIARRNLIVGYGPKLFQSLPEFESTDFHSFGGSAMEGFFILGEYLQKFSDLHPDDEILKQISHDFQQAQTIGLFDKATQLNVLAEHDKLHTLSGFIEHFVGITLHKISDEHYQMLLADRGFFYARHFGKTKQNKSPSLQSIIVPKQMLTDTISSLNQAFDSDLDTGKNILFGSIPFLLKNEWQPVKSIQQGKIKCGICFFTNVKTLIRHEFERVYPSASGHARYKEFSRFLREQLLQDYSQFTEQDDAYTFICKEKLAAKYHNLGDGGLSLRF